MAGPELIAGAGLIATIVGTGVSIDQSHKESARRKKQLSAVAGVEAEVRRKEALLESRENRSRQRRSAGFGQKSTILGGGATSEEVQRSVLLGQ